MAEPKRVLIPGHGCYAAADDVAKLEVVQNGANSFRVMAWLHNPDTKASGSATFAVLTDNVESQTEAQALCDQIAATYFDAAGPASWPDTGEVRPLVS